MGVVWNLQCQHKVKQQFELYFFQKKEWKSDISWMAFFFLYFPQSIFPSSAIWARIVLNFIENILIQWKVLLILWRRLVSSWCLLIIIDFFICLLKVGCCAYTQSIFVFVFFHSKMYLYWNFRESVLAVLYILVYLSPTRFDERGLWRPFEKAWNTLSISETNSAWKNEVFLETIKNDNMFSDYIKGEIHCPFNWIA